MNDEDFFFSGEAGKKSVDASQKFPCFFLFGQEENSKFTYLRGGDTLRKEHLLVYPMVRRSGF